MPPEEAAQPDSDIEEVDQGSSPENSAPQAVDEDEDGVASADTSKTVDLHDDNTLAVKKTGKSGVTGSGKDYVAIENDDDIIEIIEID